ncbi:MAG: STAS/SEC14 domain-containing protein [Thermoanaerobaculia bacterium]
MPEVHSIGNHKTGYEEPDILYMKLVGEVTYDEVREINRVHLDYGRERGRLFYLIDLSELDNLPAQVRREASDAVKVLPLRGTAIYGAPLRAKVLAKLLMTAVNMFKGGRNQNPVEFTDTEREARQWLDRRRREVDGGAS